ncbi:hypothetical protein Bp8pS_156 [Bacillus phage vB_BpuM-BpSp]|nr:hypothetical protein Bp8pS_156 [Bacillus phage vB_BpuM-BpSp]
MDNQHPSLLVNEDECFQLLIGTLLGDSTIEKKNRSIVNTQSIIHRDYVEMKYNIFKKYYKVGVLGESKNWGTNPKEELRVGIRYRIWDKELSNKIERIMFDENHKRIIPNDLNIITPLTLLFWYLDDGAFIVRDNGKYIRRSLRIGLKSFSDESILRLIDYLKEKYDISFRAEYDKGRNTILKICMESVKEIAKFLELMYPFYNYIPKSLNYKFQPYFKETHLSHLNLV